MRVKGRYTEETEDGCENLNNDDVEEVNQLYGGALALRIGTSDGLTPNKKKEQRKK